MKANYHGKAIDDGILEDILRNLFDLQQALLPYATPLTPQDKRKLLKMGEKNLSFVEKSYEYANINPLISKGLIPRRSAARNWGCGGFVPPHTQSLQGEIFNTPRLCRGDFLFGAKEFKHG